MLRDFVNFGDYIDLSVNSIVSKQNGNFSLCKFVKETIKTNFPNSLNNSRINKPSIAIR